METDEFQRQVRFEHYRTSIDLVREFGLLAIKTLITLNSGAFIVLLTFIGNAAAQSMYLVPISTLKLSMFLFLIGLTLAGVSIAVAYISAQAATPYVMDKEPESDIKFLAKMMLPPVLSFIVFVVGVGNLVFNILPA